MDSAGLMARHYWIMKFVWTQLCILSKRNTILEKTLNQVQMFNLSTSPITMKFVIRQKPLLGKTSENSSASATTTTTGNNGSAPAFTTSTVNYSSAPASTTTTTTTEDNNSKIDHTCTINWYLVTIMIQMLPFLLV